MHALDLLEEVDLEMMRILHIYRRRLAEWVSDKVRVASETVRYGQKCFLNLSLPVVHSQSLDRADKAGTFQLQGCIGCRRLTDRGRLLPAAKSDRPTIVRTIVGTSLALVHLVPFVAVHIGVKQGRHRCLERPSL